jgi:hypothetical protein
MEGHGILPIFAIHRHSCFGWNCIRRSFPSFMLLSVGIKLLAYPVHHNSFNTYAHQLLEMFVQQSSILCGFEFVLYNAHGLVHMSAEVMAHGCLDSY